MGTGLSKVGHKVAGCSRVFRLEFNRAWLGFCKFFLSDLKFSGFWWLGFETRL